MRSADAITLLRVLIIIAAAYLIVAKFNPIAIVLSIAVAMALDAVDGYFAVRQSSSGRVGFGMYLGALSGNHAAAAKVRQFRAKASRESRFGPRIDVAGDRAVEYILWITYTYVGILPLFVIFLVVLRHSFADAVMAAKGTSSKMKTRFARIVYSSNVGRAGINVVKFLAFAYLALMYVWGYPAIIGYMLVTILLAYILLRGAAEIYEAYA